MRKSLIIFAGLGFLAVSLAVLLSREEIAIRWRLRHLRGNPEYLGTILDEPEGTPERAAVRRYLTTAEGKRALIQHSLPRSEIASMSRSRPPRLQIYLDFERKTVRFVCDVPVGAEGGFVEFIPGFFVARVSRGYRGELVVSEAWLELAAEHLVKGELLELPELPGTCFEVGRIDFGRPGRAIACD